MSRFLSSAPLVWLGPLSALGSPSLPEKPPSARLPLLPVARGFGLADCSTQTGMLKMQLRFPQVCIKDDVGFGKSTYAAVFCDATAQNKGRMGVYLLNAKTLGTAILPNLLNI